MTPNLAKVDKSNMAQYILVVKLLWGILESWFPGSQFVLI